MTVIKYLKMVRIFFRNSLIFIIRIYQIVKSKLGVKPHCRFYPSCSQYMIDAIIKYGIFKGVFLGILRILRCHPFNPGGYDPVK